MQKTFIIIALMSIAMCSTAQTYPFISCFQIYEKFNSGINKKDTPADLVKRDSLLQLAEIEIKHKCPNDSALAWVYLSQSRVYRLQKNYEKAFSFIEKALKRADSLNIKVTSYSKKQDTDEYHLKFEAIEEKARICRSYATFLNNDKKIDYKNALRYFLMADSLYKAINDTAKIEYIRTLGTGTAIYLNIGQPQDAILLAQKALYSHRKLDKSNADYNKTTDNILVSLYQIQIKLNDYPAAATTLKELETLRKETLKDDLGVAEVHAWRAHDLIDIGKLKQADAELDKGFLILKQQNKTSGGVYAELLRNKAKWCYTIFDYETALRYADSAINVTNRRDFKALSIREKARPLNQKARILSQLKRYDEALKIQEGVLKIDTLVNVLQDIQNVYHLASFAEIQYEKRDFQQAVLTYKAALKIAAPFGKTNRMAYLPSLFALSQAEYATKNYADALAHLDTLQAGYEKETGKNSDYAQATILRGRALQATKQYEEAATAYIEGLGLMQKEYRIVLTELSEKQQTDLQANLRQAMQYFCTMPPAFLQKYTEILYDLQLQNKAILLNVYEKQQRLAEQIAQRNDKVAQVLADLNASRQKYSMANNLKIQTELAERIAVKEIELHKLLPNVFADKAFKTIATKGLTQKLKPHEAAIEIITFPDAEDTTKTHYAALILTKNSKEPQMVMLPTNGKDMEGKYLKNYTENKRNKQTLQKAYAIYWQPIADALGDDIKTVWLAPEGVYHRLSIGTLCIADKGKDDGQYLAEKLDIRTVMTTRAVIDVPRLSDVPRFSAGGATNHTIALFGDPDYYAIPLDSSQTNQLIKSTAMATAAESRRTLREGDETLPRLEYTKQEVNTIDSLLKAKGWKTTPFLAEKATESQLKQLVIPTVLHIATHGNYDASEGQNPLLYAKLYLAGAANTLEAKDKPNYTPSHEDGILNGMEASLLNLQGCDLVVLSACETGLGDVRSNEGVYGFSRAFRMAGARAVLMSLWKVDDKGTSELMQRFYKKWSGGGLSKRAAFNAAQREMIREQDAKGNPKWSPNEWGAFVLVE